MRKFGVHVIVLGVAFIVSNVVGSVASAQPIGTFRWQLEPYCNKVSVFVTQVGAVYSLDGYDDQCGAGQRAPVVGTAAMNPDGTIGFGLNIVTVPGGGPIHVDGRMGLSTLSGTWADSAGGSGPFIFNGNVPGSPRPLPDRVTQYVFPTHDFVTSAGVTVTLPGVTQDQMNQSSWSVELVRSSGNVYPIPGPGVNGTSTYRVYWFPAGGGTVGLTLSKATGAGEIYASIRVVRTPASARVP